MTTIKIPTAGELEAGLQGLERLLTAKEWERAAIVHAFTRNDGKGRPEKMSDSGHFPATVADFAKLGFAGLKKRATVATYRKRWQEAIEAGLAPSVQPGDEIELPNLPWPPTRTGTDGDAKKESKKAKAKEYLADPEIGLEIVQEYLADPEQAREVVSDEATKVNLRKAAKADADEKAAVAEAEHEAMLAAMTPEQRANYEQSEADAQRIEDSGLYVQAQGKLDSAAQALRDAGKLVHDARQAGVLGEARVESLISAFDRVLRHAEAGKALLSDSVNDLDDELAKLLADEGGA
ncbi:MAG TPA: hypothetical protein VK735_45770 [Pseudonocardia sp.]|uniref:hypothetical protein n=1 Tax=Pseudonocardia sp. TaxID=60912 RepID=UPI002D0D7C2F|nr:hypothetical protein [Pseudonocardia sp.]HTF54798.1 hypothetical protein [Pseudonocardia sp.]